MGRHPWRPSHLHYIASAPGHASLVTEDFPDDDPYLDQDTVFSVRDDQVMSYETRAPETFPDGMAVSGTVTEPYLYVRFDLVLAPELSDLGGKPQSAIAARGESCHNRIKCNSWDYL